MLGKIKEKYLSSRCEELACTDEVGINGIWKFSVEWLCEPELIAGMTLVFSNFHDAGGFPCTIVKINYMLEDDRLYDANKLANGVFGIVEVFFDEAPLSAEFLLSEEYHLVDTAGKVVANILPIFKLRRSQNVVWQQTTITRSLRSQRLGQLPCTIWFTGLSGSGKSTLANALEVQLVSFGYRTMLIDGDNVRRGLNYNLGFTEQDRIENIRRVAEVAKLMNDAGLIVIASFISPLERDRSLAKSIIGNGNFTEVFVSTPLSVCEERDVKGLYAKARRGKIPNFTGIDSPYEKPHCADVSIDTTNIEIDLAVKYIISHCSNKITLRAC